MPKADDRFQRQFAASPIPTLLWVRRDGEFIFEEANPAAIALAKELIDEFLQQPATLMYRERPDMVELLERVWTEQRAIAHDLPFRLLVGGVERVFRVDVAPLPPDRLVLLAIDVTAQHAAEESSRVNARRNDILFEQSSDGIIRLDDLGLAVEVNPAAAAMFGYEGPALIGVPIFNLADDDDQAPLSSHGETFVWERTFRRGDGGTVQIEMSGRALEGGGQLLLLRDLTARRAREAALRQREQQSWRMVEMSPDAICVVTEGVIVYVNAAFLHLAGATTRDQIIGEPVVSFVHPEDRGQVLDRLQQIMESDVARSPAMERLIRLDGGIVYVEVAGMSLEYEGRRSVQAVLRNVTDRVKQQEALERSEERYRGLFENSSELIYRLGADGRVLEVNPAVSGVTGWSASELAGKPFDLFVHPDDVPGAIETFQATVAGHPSRRTIRVKTKQGGYVALDTVNNPEMQDGRVVALFGTGRDISAARAATERLKESEQLLSTVLDRLPIGVVVVAEDGTIVRSNPAADTIWGFHRTEIAMRSPSTYHAWWVESGEPIKTGEWASTRALVRGETSLNQLIDIERFDGGHRIIMNSAVPLIDGNGNVRGAVVLNQDVTEARVNEEQREAMAARLREVISSTSDGICTIDTAGRATLVSPAAAEMLGTSVEELLGENLHAIVHCERSREPGNVFVEVMQTRQARPLYEDVFWRQNGTSFDAEVSCAPILVGDEAHGAVVTFRDVTHRNALERELERAQRLSAIGQLAATVAHEFNNVLMGISPFMEVIDRRAQSDEQLRSISEPIQHALQRGKQITREILKFAQSPEPELRPLRLRILLESSIPELSAIAGRKITVELNRVDDDLAACVDATQVHQALSNLVSNARDAMNGEGSITIACGLAAPRESRHLPPGEWVSISVTDRGEGIRPEIIERIFEPLYTTKQAGGTGLGLAVVQQVVRKHGGVVDVVSEPGVGTTFRLYFRRCDPPEITAIPQSPRIGRAVRTLLLVEDDETVSAGIKAILELEGITAHVVRLGADAEDAVARFSPDAVVLDRGLPDMDGLDVSRRLLARWPDLPIVFSTGHGGREDIEEVSRNARVAYLLKPYAITTLLAALDQILPEPAAEDPAG